MIWKSVANKILKLIILLIIAAALTGCYETKKQSYSERRGLMLLQPKEYARNKPLKFDKQKMKKQLQKKTKKRDKRR